MPDGKSVMFEGVALVPIIIGLAARKYYWLVSERSWAAFLVLKLPMAEVCLPATGKSA